LLWLKRGELQDAQPSPDGSAALARSFASRKGGNKASAPPDLSSDHFRTCGAYQQATPGASIAPPHVRLSNGQGVNHQRVVVDWAKLAILRPGVRVQIHDRGRNLTLAFIHCRNDPVHGLKYEVQGVGQRPQPGRGSQSQAVRAKGSSRTSCSRSPPGPAAQMAGGRFLQG